LSAVAASSIGKVAAILVTLSSRVNGLRDFRTLIRDLPRDRCGEKNFFSATAQFSAAPLSGNDRDR
jgi:hypothetical protein